MQNNSVLDYIMRFIYSFHMPLFMFVSGAVYHRCILAGKYKEIPKFVVKKFRRLMIPYLFWGICWVTPVMVLLGFTEQSPLKYIVEGILLCRNSRHLWFLWALFFVSFGFRLLRTVVERGKVWRFLLLTIFLILWYISWNLTDMLAINSIMRYLLWYYLGYLFDREKTQIDYIIEKAAWRAVVVFIITVLIIIIYIQTGNNLWTGLVAAGAGIMLCYSFAWLVKGKICDKTIYCVLERDCFGIYLVHPMIIYFCFYYLRDIMQNPYIVSALVILFALVISGIITEILRKIRFQIVLGE